MITPIELKANGMYQRTTLSRLSSASITPHEQAVQSQQNWCLHPNHSDREIVEADIGDLRQAFNGVYDAAACDWIQTMHRRMAEATGRGSWRPGKECHPTYYPHEGYHAALLFIEHEQFLQHQDMRRAVSDEEWQTVIVDARCWPTVANPVKSIADCKRTFIYGGEAVASIDKPEWLQASEKRDGDVYNVFDMSTWVVLESTRRTGCFYLEIFDGENGSEHNVHEKMIPIPGGTSGFAYFNNGTCGDHVTSNIDNTISYSLGRACGLRFHEIGHTNNLQHEFRSPQSAHRSFMSYDQDNTPFQGARLAVDPYWVNQPGNRVEDHSWDDLRRFYGGEAAKPVIEPETPPTPDMERLWKLFEEWLRIQQT